MNENDKKNLLARGIPQEVLTSAEAKSFSFYDILMVVGLVEKYGPAIKDMIEDIVKVFTKK